MYIPWHGQLPELSSTNKSRTRLRWFNGEGAETGIVEIFPAPDKESKEKPALREGSALCREVLSESSTSSVSYMVLQGQSGSLVRIIFRKNH